MTGQMMSGTPPMDAVKYQHVIMFLIGASTTLCTLFCCWMSFQRVVDRTFHVVNMDALLEQKGFSQYFRTIISRLK